MSKIPRHIPQARTPRRVNQQFADGWGASGRAEPDLWVFSSLQNTAGDRQFLSWCAACFFGLVALGLAKMLTALLDWAIGENSVTEWLWLVAMPGGAIWGFVKQRTKPRQVWTWRKWIDFGERTWNERYDYPEGDAPVESTTLSLDGIAAVCCTRTFEDGVGYDCVLAPVKEMVQYGYLNTLTHVDTFRSEEECLAYTRDVAARCAIACWQFREAEEEGGKPTWFAVPP